MSKPSYIIVQGDTLPDLIVECNKYPEYYPSSQPYLDVKKKHNQVMYLPHAKPKRWWHG